MPRSLYEIFNCALFFASSASPPPVALFPFKVYKARYVISIALFLLASFFIAVSVTDLGVVLALVGASGSTIISYIIPGLFYYKMYGNKPGGEAGVVGVDAETGVTQRVEDPRTEGQVEGQTGRVGGSERGSETVAESGEPVWKRYMALIQCLCGMLLIPVCLTMIIVDAASR